MPINLELVEEKFDYIIFSDLVDDLWDVQLFLEQLPRLCKDTTRLVFNFYSHLCKSPPPTCSSCRPGYSNAVKELV